MPNIIVNNYCNQQCSYCFANANMKDMTLQKNMKLSTYIMILKYLRMIGDNQVRILGGEPTIFPSLRKYIDIAEKGGFHIIVFSNINTDPLVFRKIFTGTKNVRINCNINDRSFYSEKEKKQIHANLRFLSEAKIPTILGYNILDISIFPDFIIELGRTYAFSDVNLKITNSSLGEKLMIDTASRDFGKYIYSCVTKYSGDFSIEFSCGLSPDIFTQDERDFIQNEAGIELFFGCDGHRGRFDINTDGSIFKCYPLESQFIQKKVYISELLKTQENFDTTLSRLYTGYYSTTECTAHKYIKGIL